MGNASLVLNVTASESRWRSRLSDGASLFSWRVEKGVESVAVKGGYIPDCVYLCIHGVDGMQ